MFLDNLMSILVLFYEYFKSLSSTNGFKTYVDVMTGEKLTSI